MLLPLHSGPPPIAYIIAIVGLMKKVMRLALYI